MTTAIDHVRPWLTPSSAFATTTQAQLGATPTSTGTGSAIIHPAISRRRRPRRCASAPAPRFVKAFENPKATRNDSTAAFDLSPKSWRPIRGSVERSSPTIAPTNAVMPTSRVNCEAFSRSPRRTGAEPVTARLCLLELLGEDEKRTPEDVRGDPRDHDSLRDRTH